MKDNRFQLVLRAGLWLDAWTAQRWDLLVAKFPGLQLVQGVNSGAAASGNTHRGLGVLDSYLGKWAKKWRDVLRYAFEIGFFGWYRPELWRWVGKKKVLVWKTHIHLGVRGHAKMAASLKAQFTSWVNRRNGLVGNGPDAFTWRPKNYKKAAPYKAPATKPARKVKPWHNIGWLNTAGNNKVLAATFNTRAPDMTATAAAGSPALHGFCEVGSDQIGELKREMAKHGYLFTAYSHMIAVFHRPDVIIRGTSFLRYSQQDGGTVEGLLRVKYTADGSKAQVGFTHLDHDSSEAKKRSNLTEAYYGLRRYGLATLLPDWKSRTTIVGDLNDVDVAAKVLKPLGFKQIVGAGLIDQAWVGAKRADRGGASTKTKSDHKRILARLGKY